MQTETQQNSETKLTESYAKLSDVQVGDVLIADGGFTCIAEGERLTVARNDKGDLYVPCRDGSHCLDGQCDDDRGYLVGLSWPGAAPQTLSDFERKILRQIAGLEPPMQWGAAIGVALEALFYGGFITSKWNGDLTDKARAAISRATEG